MANTRQDTPIGAAETASGGAQEPATQVGSREPATQGGNATPGASAAKPARKRYLDNLRSLTIVLVVVYHVFYSFNSAGVVTNLGNRGLGIPLADIVCYALNPWFMCFMFLVAGMSARYSLATRRPGAFLAERARKLLVPLAGGMFLLGWINGYATDLSEHFTAVIFGDAVDQIPWVVKYLFYVMSGVGPLWFLPELFVGCVILVALRRIDSQDRIYAFCGRVFTGKAGAALVALLALALWGASHVLNTPVVVAFRNGIYWLCLLLGHYVFAHEGVLAGIKKLALPYFALACAFGALFTWMFFGQDYVSDAAQQHIVTNCFAWFACMAALGCGQRWLDGANRFWAFLNRRSFGLYVFHYPLLVAIAYFFVTRAPQIPMAALYAILVVIIFPATLLFNEIVSRVPVLRTLLLGAGGGKKRAADATA